MSIRGPAVLPPWVRAKRYMPGTVLGLKLRDSYYYEYHNVIYTNKKKSFWPLLFVHAVITPARPCCEARNPHYDFVYFQTKLASSPSLSYLTDYAWKRNTTSWFDPKVASSSNCSLETLLARYCVQTCRP